MVEPSRGVAEMSYCLDNLPSIRYDNQSTTIKYDLILNQSRRIRAYGTIVMEMV